MKHLAAYLLLQMGGNSSPSASDIKSLFDTVGIEAEEERLDKLISELEGKDVNEVGWRFPTFYGYKSAWFSTCEKWEKEG